jgi:hypothetical protein
LLVLLLLLFGQWPSGHARQHAERLPLSLAASCRLLPLLLFKGHLRRLHSTSSSRKRPPGQHDITQ